MAVEDRVRDETWGHAVTDSIDGVDAFLLERIETDIENALTARGLTKVAGRSDLNVRFQFGAARKMEIERYPAGWYGLGTRVVRVPYSEGTLVIDLRNPATTSLVWRAIATEEKSDPSKIEGKLNDMVRKSLEKYPPKQK